MDWAWVGIDAGKEMHWAHVLDASGTELLSRKVENDEAKLSELIDEASPLAEEVLWAVDQPGGGAALLLALLWVGDQKILYFPGLSVDRARQRPIAGSPKPMPEMPASSPTPVSDEIGPRRACAG